MRHFDHWGDLAIRAKIEVVLNKKWEELKEDDQNAKKPPLAGLVVPIYEPSPTIPAGSVKRDLIYWSGAPIMLLQLGISAIHCGIFSEWGILMITACGIALSITTGLLP
jgi:hypothetical protein